MSMITNEHKLALLGLLLACGVCGSSSGMIAPVRRGSAVCFRGEEIHACTFFDGSAVEAIMSTYSI